MIRRTAALPERPLSEQERQHLLNQFLKLDESPGISNDSRWDRWKGHRCCCWSVGGSNKGGRTSSSAPVVSMSPTGSARGGLCQFFRNAIYCRSGRCSHL